MSDIGTETRPASFFDLYRLGKARADGIDDYVGRWHDDVEPWAKDLPLHEYLGLTRTEYEVLLCDAEALPQILAARVSQRPWAEVMAARLRELKAVGRSNDQTTITLVGNWLARQQAA